MVSIIIPAYNEEKYLGPCLESFVAQTYGDPFEIIVVNNASTDRTREIALSFADRLPLVVIDEPRKGRGQARATGFANTKGDIILMTDADAQVPPTWIEEMLAPFTQPQVIAVSSAARIGDCDPISNWMYSLGDLIYMWSYRLFLGYHTVVGFSLAIRRSAYEKSGGFDARMKAQEDVEFGTRLHKEGKIVFLPKLYVDVSGRRFKGGVFNGMFQYVQTTFEFFVLKKISIDLDDVR